MTATHALDAIRTWPPLIAAKSADEALGISYTLGKRLRATGEYPLPTLTLGRLHKVRTSDLVAFLDGANVQASAGVTVLPVRLVPDGVAESA
jgi:hypothetical protein